MPLITAFIGILFNYVIINDIFNSLYFRSPILRINSTVQDVTSEAYNSVNEY